jgi:eukaryotic-like serine/threonine-protein kinase
VSQSDPQGSDLVGTVLGDAYRLTRLIGRGGMGSVYEGVQLRLNKRVAVKLMARELAANAEALARFRREAEVTSQLGHPHIVQVFDFGAAPSGEPYLVMEFLEGEALDRRIERLGRLPLEMVRHVVRQTAAALEAAHAQGIVHRDLKPANILLLSLPGEADFVKVVDFGISKVKAATTRITRSSMLIGTPEYMSPEQASGHADEVDHWSDQWALAAMTYQMLAGQPPFAAEDVRALLFQVTLNDPPPLRSRVPDLPPEIEAVVMRGLSKKPSDRFPSITAFARALDGESAEAAVQPGATPVPAPPPVRDDSEELVVPSIWTPRSTWIAIGVGLAMLVAAVLMLR